MKNILISLIAGITFILFITELVRIIQYIVTIYVNVNEHIKGNVNLRHTRLLILIGILIALEVYLITM